MLAFIESIIKLIINLLFADRLSKDNEELRAEVQQLRQEKEESGRDREELNKEVQRLKREKEELAKAKAEVIENHFSLFQKYLTLNKQKEELAEKSERYQSHRLDINQEFNPEDWKVIDQLLEEFSSSEELTI